VIPEDDLLDPRMEWLEADGAGGFAMGTASGIRTRRYHGLLCVARRPPTARVLLVSAVEAWIDLGRGPRALSSHRYLPATTHPDGAGRLVAFDPDPFPTWTYELEDGVRVVQELVVPRQAGPGDPGRVVLRWRLEGAPRAARLTLRPLLAARDVHSLRREEARLDLGSAQGAHAVRWQPDPDLPAVRALTNGVYSAEPLWYRNFLYEEERARGYDHVEDLAAPGFFAHEMADGPACLVLEAEGRGPAPALVTDAPVGELVDEILRREAATRSGLSVLDRAADAYLVRRGDGKSLIAGYPWFTDWGRDTFLSLRGLLLARGRTAEAAEILTAWSDHVSHGMLPNRFPDDGEAEFNSVDASLWYVVAVEETLAVAKLSRAERAVLENAALAILEGYAGGTRYGIRADADGLLACGEPGLQLTWMDAKVGDQVMTPRIGKPVEIQALWIQALAFGARFDRRYRALGERAGQSFEERFWNEQAGYLNDVVDCDHVHGTADTTLRPNQVLAVGGLPRVLVTNGRARRIVDVLERELWTPLGLRTLPRDDPRYQGHYRGDPLERDRAYHQGTVWPWLLGPFVDAWLRVQGGGEEAKRLARERFLAPVRAHLARAGLGHVSEVADGEPPHEPGGCPFQAWSVGELVRLERAVLAPATSTEAASRTRARRGGG